MSMGLVCSLGVGRFLEWEAVNLRGTVGGIMVFWANRVLQLVGLEVGKFSILCWFKNCQYDFSWIFIGIYGLAPKREREYFWGELEAIKDLWSNHWCVADDFNMIRFPQGCSSGGRLISTMRRFSEVIEDL